MAYFIRRYQKGVAQSGTTDVFVSDSEIPISMFCEMAEMVGPGKYILGQRGEGIRGFKKITDTIVPEPIMKVFAAEDESNKEDSDSKEDTNEDDTPEVTPELVEKKEKATSPPPAPKTVERETISMRRTEKLSDMSNEQLSELLSRPRPSSHRNGRAWYDNTTKECRRPNCYRNWIQPVGCFWCWRSSRSCSRCFR